MNEALAKKRFMALQVIRFIGVGLAFLGAAVVAGKTGLPRPFGYVFLAFGAVDALILPVVVLRMWKSQSK